MNLESSLENADEKRTLRLRDSLQLIENMIQQTRTMTFELYPAMLEDLGLLPTVRRYGEQIHERAGIQMTINEIGTGRKIPAYVGDLASYRVYMINHEDEGLMGQFTVR